MGVAREPALGQAYPEGMSRITGSWLSGPPTVGPRADAGTYRGELLGLPETGVGSLAPDGRRVAALFVDWFIAVGIASFIVRLTQPHQGVLTGGATDTWALLVWFVMGVAAVALFDYTPGQFFLGIRVARVDADARVGFVRALARSVALVFVVPALFTDGDRRGMHDRATGTALVRAR